MSALKRGVAVVQADSAIAAESPIEHRKRLELIAPPQKQERAQQMLPAQLVRMSPVALQTKSARARQTARLPAY